MCNVDMAENLPDTTELFTGLATHLHNRIPSGSTLRGYNLQNIDDALRKNPFQYGELTIQDSNQAHNYLQKKFFHLLPANHPALTQIREPNLKLNIHLLSVNSIANTDKLKAKFSLLASWDAATEHSRSPNDRNPIPVCICSVQQTQAPIDNRFSIFRNTNPYQIRSGSDAFFLIIMIGSWELSLGLD